VAPVTPTPKVDFTVLVFRACCGVLFDFSITLGEDWVNTEGVVEVTVLPIGNSVGSSE
jgi:hypothetical protein